MEEEGTGSKAGWTWAVVEACIAVATAAAVAGAKAVRQPWLIHGAVGQTGSLWVALRSRSSAGVGNVSWDRRDR